MNKLTQEFIRPYVEEWVKLKCPHYGKMLLDTVVNSTIGSDDGMSFALRNYIFGYVHADINKLKMDNAALKAELARYEWRSGHPEHEEPVLVRCYYPFEEAYWYQVARWSMKKRKWDIYGYGKLNILAWSEIRPYGGE